LYANLFEWAIHKYLLHGLGRKRGTFWSFHFHEHHRRTIKGKGIDRVYKVDHFYGKELWALAFLILVHVPFLWIEPVFAITIFTYIAAYYYVHVKSHMDVKWAKKWIPWHYDHHMGGKEANWGVLLPLIDKILGTRVYYIGTSKYYRDELKKGN